MPHRLKLLPLQRYILMMLEVAGDETVSRLIATVKLPDQSGFAAQIDGLVNLGLIRKEENRFVLTELGRIALRT